MEEESSLREKCPKTEYFSGPFFQAFGLNMERYGVQIRSYFCSVFSHIRTEYGPEITPYLDTFHAVVTFRKVARWNNYLFNKKSTIISQESLKNSCRTYGNSQSLHNCKEHLVLLSLLNNKNLLAQNKQQRQYKVGNMFKVTNKEPGRRNWRCSGVSIVKFDHILHLFSRACLVDFEYVFVYWVLLL